MIGRIAGKLLAGDIGVVLEAARRFHDVAACAVVADRSDPSAADLSVNSTRDED
jgi:hypothetical protein